MGGVSHFLHIAQGTKVGMVDSRLAEEEQQSLVPCQLLGQIMAKVIPHRRHLARAFGITGFIG